jgi:hypothetical protein
MAFALLAASLPCGHPGAMPRRARQLQPNCNPAHATVHKYRWCATASLARDNCGAEFLELQVRHRDFESAVAERQAKCGTDQ